MPSCRSPLFSFANISLITSGSMSALQQTVPIPWNDTDKAAGNEIVSGGFLFCAALPVLYIGAGIVHKVLRTFCTSMVAARAAKR